ncbi:YdhR family protein [Streptomyces sp. NPDC007896]|uniref:YdhR family protein n=1 Tax=Streptomyces sp. NPDC007896 TaxID=3364784 RepID=UPI0036E3611E
MHAVIVWWDLSASGQTIESMRAYLREESVDAFAEVPGLRFKMWVSDPDANRWGAVLLWESKEAAQQPLPSRALELIGYPATVAHTFDVEATIEGRYETQQLGRRGLAFDESAAAVQQ